MTSPLPAVAAWESLFRAQVAVMRSLSPSFTATELSFNEYDVLFNLSRLPHRSCRLGELQRHVLLSQPSISRLVDRLVQRGLLAKSADPRDGRGTVVSLTDDGYRTFLEVARVHTAAIATRLGSALNEGELDILRQLCDRLRDQTR